jgi:hypothetical protein
METLTLVEEEIAIPELWASAMVTPPPDLVP